MPVLKINEIIALLESSIRDPTAGLPEELFLFVSRITPLVNVDLLIKNERNQTLLTWRDDGFFPPGWHIPGGIIRYKETIADRVKAVAKNELGAEVAFSAVPLAMNEIIREKRATRGHFISLLYQCSLLTPLDAKLESKCDPPRRHEWRWHEACPADIIRAHEIYRDHF